MEKIHLSKHIDAPREKVWDIMLGEETYRDWSSAFSEGSYYKGDWEIGSKISFVGPDPDGGGETGMVARVTDNRRPEYVAVEHYGIVKQGQEDTESDEAKKWTPAVESYSFIEKNGGTELTIEVDIAESERGMMEEMWQKALVRLKELCEK